MHHEMKKSTMEELLVPDAVCTSCRRCCAGCPAQIDIPSALKLYEIWQQDQEEALDLLSFTQAGGQPVDCIECGVCTACCPHGREQGKIVRQLAMIQACQKNVTNK